MTDGTLTFVALVFIAVFLLAQGMIVPVFGENRKTAKRLKERLAEVDRATGGEKISSLLRQKYLNTLSPWEARLESIPMMERLGALMESGGIRGLAYRVVLLSIGLAILAGFISWIFLRSPGASLVASLVGLGLPVWWLKQAAARRMALFDEQLPDAVDVMRRALMAGHPFNAALKLVSEDMEDPVAQEFRLTFADLNYGNDVRRAMLGLLGRMPSVSVMALVTSIMVQKETGGNLAEILGQISSVIRGRFRLHRKVRTMSAEGRMSAWVLGLVPLVLFAALMMIQPDYLPSMFENETGKQILIGTVLWSSIGIFFIRKIIQIDV